MFRCGDANEDGGEGEDRGEDEGVEGGIAAENDGRFLQLGDGSGARI